MQLLVNQLKPLLQQYKVHAYLAGHDHCAEYLDEGLGVQYHGIGASHGCDSSTANQGNVPAVSGGSLGMGCCSLVLCFVCRARCLLVLNSRPPPLPHPIPPLRAP
jgi:hypothetical protein